MAGNGHFLLRLAIQYKQWIWQGDSVKLGVVKQNYLMYSIIGLVAGIVITTFFLERESGLAMLFGQEYLNNYNVVTVDKVHFFTYVLLNRIKLLIIWHMLGISCNYRLLYGVATGLMGLMLGGFGGIMILNYGMYGLVLTIWMILPHWGFYCMAGALIVKKRLMGTSGTSGTVVVYGLVLLLVFAGCALESLLTPMILKNIIE